MINKITNFEDIKKFVYFKKDLYGDNPYYIDPMYASLIKDLELHLLEKKDYSAFLYTKNDQVFGRIMICYDKDQGLGQEVCFFSMFDFINNIEVPEQLLEEVYKDMKNHQISTLYGPYCPYDPDTERGFLVEGFNNKGALYLSYNYDYYGKIMEKLGFTKLNDAFTSSIKLENLKDIHQIEEIAHWYSQKSNVKVVKGDLSNPDKTVDDVYKILLNSQDEINFQECPSKDVIESIFKNLKPLVHKDFFYIAYDNNEPVGMTLMIPDYSSIIKKNKGVLKPLKLLINKPFIKKYTAKLQYISKKYQNTGLLATLVMKNYEAIKKHHIQEIEFGVFGEANHRSSGLCDKYGAIKNKVFRVYQKEI